MEQQRLIQHMDKASRIAAAFDSHLSERAPHETIAIFREIFSEREMQDPAMPFTYHRVHQFYSSVMRGTGYRPSLVFLDTHHIRRVRLWCERRSIGTANNLPMTGAGLIPDEVWGRLRSYVGQRVGRCRFYYAVYGDDRSKAEARCQEVLAASRRSPPLMWLALTQQEKEKYFEIESREQQ